MRRRRSSFAPRIAVMAAAAPLALLAALHGGAVAQTNRSPPVRVIVDHAQALRLSSSPSIVLVANPDIADIVNERNNLLFVLGRKPGLTNLLVYDDKGNALLSREIVVVPDTSQLVTITRQTDVSNYICEPNCVLYDREASVSAITNGAGGLTQGQAQPTGLVNPANPAPATNGAAPAAAAPTAAPGAATSTR